VSLVAGWAEPEEFHRYGKYAATWISEMPARNDVPPRELGRVLDFGCGAGRVIRHWPAISDCELHGCDYNPYLVQWCADNLPFGEFRANELEPPLPYDDDFFDCVYSLSIFTHLDAELQVPWMEEAGELVVLESEHSGSSGCAAYHPERYVREVLAGDLAIVDYSPGGALDIQQDAVLFRKPEAR
jgi:SAM-dependent methyltransferase